MATATQTFSRIEPWQRYKKRNPCPICTGGDDDKRGRGERCSGYISGDEQYAHCTREEYAGDLRPTKASPPTYGHRLNGECRCGQPHGVYVSRKPVKRAEKPLTRRHLSKPPHLRLHLHLPRGHWRALYARPAL